MSSQRNSFFFKKQNMTNRYANLHHNALSRRPHNNLKGSLHNKCVHGSITKLKQFRATINSMFIQRLCVSKLQVVCTSWTAQRIRFYITSFRRSIAPPSSILCVAVVASVPLPPIREVSWSILQKRIKSELCFQEMSVIDRLEVIRPNLHNRSPPTLFLSNPGGILWEKEHIK